MRSRLPAAAAFPTGFAYLLTCDSVFRRTRRQDGFEGDPWSERWFLWHPALALVLAALKLMAGCADLGVAPSRGLDCEGGMRTAIRELRGVEISGGGERQPSGLVNGG